MSSRIAFQLVAFSFLATALPRSAMASPTFPDVIREELGLDAAPSCTICHDNPSGGLGTATTPFAVYLRSRGLRAGDAGSLRTALAAADGERHDSDGDGVPDVDELSAGGDPNAGPGDSPPPPGFGCGAQIAPTAPVNPSVFLFLASVAIWRVARKRRC